MAITVTWSVTPAVPFLPTQQIRSVVNGAATLHQGWCQTQATSRCINCYRSSCTFKETMSEFIAAVPIISSLVGLIILYDHTARYNTAQIASYGLCSVSETAWLRYRVGYSCTYKYPGLFNTTSVPLYTIRKCIRFFCGTLHS